MFNATKDECCIILPNKVWSEWEKEKLSLYCDMIARNNSNKRGIKLTGKDIGEKLVVNITDKALNSMIHKAVSY